MAETRARDLASSLGQAVKKNNILINGNLAITGIETYTNKSLLPGSYDSDDAGSLGFTTDSDRLYIHTGTAWHNIAIINTNPIWETQPSASYTLATDATAYKNGTATTITLAARDSEGAAIQWRAVQNTAFNNMAYISNDSSVFTIEPKSEDSAGQEIMPTGSVTFRASDGVNIISASASFTLTFSTLVAGSEETVLLMKAIGDDTSLNTGFDDKSSSNQTISKAGNPYLGTFSPYNSAGYSLYFDGNNGSHTDVAASSQFSIGTGAFTLEAWVICETKSTDTYYRRIFSLDGPSGNSNGNLQMTINPTTGSVDMWTNSGDLDLTGTVAIDDGKWHHVAIVRSGTTITSYVDGAVSRSGTYNGSIGTHNSSQPRPRIGSYNGSSGDFKGNIYELRLVVGTAVYTGAFNNPNVKLTNITNTKLLIQNAPFTKDNSSANHAVTVTGTQCVPVTPFKHDVFDSAIHGGSVFFDGSSDLQINHSSLAYAQNDWTIEFWFYPTDISGGSGDGLFHLADSFGGPTTTGNAVNLNTPAAYRLEGVGQGGWDSNGDYNNKTANGHHWHHFAMVRDFSAGTRKAYLNGVEDLSATSDTTNSTHTYVIGQTVYTGAFTPPSAPLTTTGGTYPSSTNITNPTASQTKLLLNNTEAKVLDHSGTTNIKLYGNAQSDTGNQKFSVPSLKFDGTGDYADTAVSPAFNFGTGDWTIEGWFYLTQGYYLWDMRVQNGNSGQHLPTLWWNNNSNSGSAVVNYWTNDSYRITSDNVSQNTWTHIAVQRIAGVVQLYLNGVRDSQTYADTYDYGSQRIRIGARGDTAGGSAITGAVSDFRVTKGKARYTNSTFTVPSAVYTG